MHLDYPVSFHILNPCACSSPSSSLKLLPTKMLVVHPQFVDSAWFAPTHHLTHCLGFLPIYELEMQEAAAKTATLT